MKRIFVSILYLAIWQITQAQLINKIIRVKEVKRIETKLSSDEMAGRRTFTPGIEKASLFIEKEFKKAGLQPFNGAPGFRQKFLMYQSTSQSLAVTLDGIAVPDSLIAGFSFQQQVVLTEKDEVEVVKIEKGANFGQQFYKYYQARKNLLVLVDPSFNSRVRTIQKMEKIAAEPGSNTVIFVFGATRVNSFSINLQNKIEKKALNNVVGMLPGSTRPNEYVIFSAHYDHLGTGTPSEGEAAGKKDSIYNGANDDAAGTTAVILLASYFKKLGNNHRTIVFAAFTAEEMGGYGAQYFSKQLTPDSVVAMFNIEMIGTPSKWGDNSAYITGFEKTNLGTILQKNLERTNFIFHPDPYPEQQLFYRSDNATLARLGVAAHTISTSKMDGEPNYHKVTDEIHTLDLNNMASIIKAIAISATSIIAGADTPTRVDTSQLR